jgi:prefoldin subunit 5
VKERLNERLEALRAEFTAGQTMLAELDTRQAELRQTMLRISGAIQVLEELLLNGDDDGHAGE